MYLDPGSASFIVQAVIAGVVGIGTAVRLYWDRLSATFSRIRKARRVD
jgi:Flp pilus assembly pilin Flp